MLVQKLHHVASDKKKSFLVFWPTHIMQGSSRARAARKPLMTPRVLDSNAHESSHLFPAARKNKELASEKAAESEEW